VVEKQCLAVGRREVGERGAADEVAEAVEICVVVSVKLQFRYIRTFQTQLMREDINTKSEYV
jgi:hypothetical protein